jgi:hypothetical protein
MEQTNVKWLAAVQLHYAGSEPHWPYASDTATRNTLSV